MSGDGKNVEDSESTRLLELDKPIRKLNAPTFRRKVAVLLSAVSMQIVINGLVFGLPVFYPELIAAFDSTRSDAVLVQSLYSGISTGGGILFTPFTMRYGLGPCAIVSVISGVVLFGVNLVASSLTMVIVTVGVLAGLVMSVSYLVPYICVSWTFHGDPGVALVMITVGSSLGQFIVPYLIEIFIQQYQWRGAFLLCGGLITQMVPFVLVIHLSREYFNTGTVERGQQEEKISRYPFDVTLLKDIVIIIIFLNAFLLSLTGNVEAWFIVDILVSRGFERKRGSFAVSVAGLAMLVGRLFGIVIQYKFRIPSVCHWIYLFPLNGIGHAIVINLSDYSAILAMVFCTVTALGVASSQTPAIMFEASGRERYPQAIAMINLMYGLGNLFSGVLGGSIRDAYGDYKPMFYLACAIAVLIALLAAIAACILNRRTYNGQSVILIKYEKLGDD